MNENELMDAMFGEDEPILPDGWQEGDDLFADAGNSVDSLLSDGAKELTDFPAENEDGASVADDPTTVEDAGDEPKSTENEPAAPEPDGGQEPEAAPSRKLKLKVNHQEEEIDVSAMSDDELIALLQKGRAFDQKVEQENKQRYRQVYQEQIDAGMTEAAAKLVAQNEAGGKNYALTDETPAEEPPAPVVKEAPVVDFKNAWSQLKALDPSLKEVPSAVADAVGKGADPQIAYLKYMMDQNAKTAASLKKENEVLKQNAASAAKAPVRGVTGGGNVTPAKTDPFLKGFDSDEW